MREQIQRKIDDGALQDARVWDLDLSAGAAPPDERFDLVVTSLVLHHVERIDEALRAFAALLEPGGHLCVLDFDHEDGSFHGEHFHGHNGFHRHEFGALLEDAGFRDVTFEDCGTVDREGRDYPLFLATATRRPACRVHALPAPFHPSGPLHPGWRLQASLREQQPCC
jgi:SAM-dependent methyltransferase